MNRHLALVLPATLTLFCLTIMSPSLAKRLDQVDKPLEPKVIHVKALGYKPQSATNQSKEGQKVFNNMNCMDCHSIHNSGGTMGPMLDGVGARRNKEYLEIRLADSSEAKLQFQKLAGEAPLSEFTHIRVPPKDASALADFLLTIPEPAGGFIVVPHMMRSPAPDPGPTKNFIPKQPTKSTSEGRRSYLKQGCVACHRIGEVGGWLGPKLDGIGGRRSRDYIARHITNATAHSSSTTTENIGRKSLMPTSALPAKDVQMIVDFLLTLPN